MSADDRKLRQDIDAFCGRRHYIQRPLRLCAPWPVRAFRWILSHPDVVINALSAAIFVATLVLVWKT